MKFQSIVKKGLTAVLALAMIDNVTYAQKEILFLDASLKGNITYNLAAKYNKLSGKIVTKKDTGSGEYTLVAITKGAVNSARVKDLSKNTSYKFKVRAVLKAGKNYNGAYSKVVTIKTSK